MENSVEAPFEELLNSCNVKLFTYNNVNGLLFISKKNKKSIFLPLLVHVISITVLGKRDIVEVKVQNIGLVIFMCLQEEQMLMSCVYKKMEKNDVYI